MLIVEAFGPLDIKYSDGESVAYLLRQSKRSALVAYLAIAYRGRFCRRDSLLALFWPDLDQDRGRHALSQALSFVRKHGCRGLIVTRGVEEVAMDPGLIRCDVVAFEQALDAGDWAGALQVYHGDLLDGLHVAGARRFVDWVDRERHRLRRLAADAAWRFAEIQLTRGDFVEAELAAERALDLMPTDEEKVRAHLTALAHSGDRGAALRLFRRFETMLDREFNVEPAPCTMALVAALRRSVNMEALVP